MVLYMKLLHVTFHQGTSLEIEYMCNQLGHDVTTMKFDDGETTDDQIYYIHYYRAQHFWNKYKDFIDTFDGVITSDTCPISRAFLQHDYSKLLIIWVCNRFDYYMPPEDIDPHYYNLLRSIRDRKNVFIVGNALLEIYHMNAKNIDINNHIIRPIGKNYIPYDLKKKMDDTTLLSDTFFVPGYYNETVYMNLSDKLNELGIKNEQRRFKDHKELSEFKAIITMPYAWSTIAFFERIQLGMVQFIPSLKFLRELMISGSYLFQPPFDKDNFDLLEISEWYCDENKDLVVFFDSWEDLLEKTKTTDYVEKSKVILKKAEYIKKQSLQSWKDIFLLYKHYFIDRFPKLTIVNDINVDKEDNDVLNKSLLRVYNYENKIRLGNLNDGGYVIADIDVTYDGYISCGIADDETFTKDFLQNKSYLTKKDCYAYDGSIDDYPWEFTTEIQFFKKYIGNINNNEYTDIHSVIQKYKNIFLAIDIEGGEYPWIMSLSTDQLNNFAQIAIELHGLCYDDDYGSSFSVKNKCIQKLCDTHYIIHAHGNNCNKVTDIPNVLELTLLNKRFFNKEPTQISYFLPIEGLDFPNDAHSDDLILGPPFTKRYNKITIGQSTTNTKIIPFKSGNIKTKLNFCNRYSDTFTYRFSNDYLFVTRTDNPGGWAQYLDAYYINDE